MKKLLLAITASTSLMFSVSNSVYAQTTGNIASANTEASNENESLSSSTKSKKSARAFKSFSRQFKNVPDAIWEITNDGGFVASFGQENVNSKVYYNEKGNYICTIKRYAESELPATVRHMVKSTYYDYAITCVEEIQFSSSTTFLVHIVFGKNFKTIRVTDEGMDIYEDLTSL